MALAHQKQRSISRRALLFGGLQLGVLGGLASRLYYLQFVKAENLSVRAENNRVKFQLVPPIRGHIIDRTGAILAENRRNYQLFLDVTAIKRADLPKILGRIRALIGLPNDLEKDIRNTASKRRFPPPFLLKGHMAWSEVAKLKLHALELPGTYIHTGQQRHYPIKDAGAHLLGYIGKVSEEDIKDKNDPLLRLPDFKIGQNGIEHMYNNRLIGEPGVRQLEVNADGLVVRELNNTPSANGDILKLTIDSRLQQFVTEQLEGQSASVVAMDVRKGDVLAMVSMPGFDPDIFSRTIPTKYWKSLRENERNPLLNKSVQGQYPPGSTFKMVVGLAALKAGKTSAATRIHCPGHYYLGNHRFNCWKPQGHGSVDMKRALASSCDTYFYTMAERLGIEAITDMAKQFGLGDAFSLGFPGEKHGLIPSKEWKQERRGARWQTGDTVNVGIGQGYILATPLQLCTMTARMASGKNKVVPRLVAGETFPEFDALDIDPEHLAIVREGMEWAVNKPVGTAYGKRILKEHHQMAGKTGTSQVKKITKRGIDQSTLPWKDRHHAFFVGYAPVYDPRIAVCVAIEHGGGGSSAAAPVARDVLAYAQTLDI